MAKRLIRAGAKASSFLRTDPDFLIIGTKRGGSTSLYNYLLAHPDVRPMVPRRQKLKGTYFFDVNHGLGESWYRSHFPTRLSLSAIERRTGRRPLVGESTPYYLYHPHAARRAAACVPDAKIIALLRNPIERAYSHYKERFRQGVEPRTFAEAVRLEPDRLAGEADRLLADERYRSLPHQMWSYVDQGRYLDGLRSWQSAYPSDQILILRSEDLYEEPRKTVRQVQDFLGLDPHEADSYRAWNKHQAADVDAATRARLGELLRQDIRDLEAHLGRDLHWA